MKIVFTLTFLLAVILFTVIGCLVIFEVFTFDEGMEFSYKALSAILLLGAASALVSLTIRNKNPPRRIGFRIKPPHTHGGRSQSRLFKKVRSQPS